MARALVAVPRHRVAWLELPAAHYDSLPAGARAQIDARLEQLRDNPRELGRGGYDEPGDSWTTTFGDGGGLISYAVVDEGTTLIVLRLV